MSQSAPLSRKGKENGEVKERSRVSISVNPPALPPHRTSAFDDDDDTDDTDTEEVSEGTHIQYCMHSVNYGPDLLCLVRL